MFDLEKIRKKNGMTLKDVAEQIGCTKQAYWYYEKGKRKLPTDKVELLAKTFKVSIEDIFLCINGNQNVNQTR